jgi:hypothetical protein
VNRKFFRTEDESIEDDNGNVVFFSLDRFVSDICEGDNCFICGKNKSEKEFNDEHVIPKWILKKYDLFKKTITLPNNESLRYDKYTVPCCCECNEYLGRMFESDISELVSVGYDKALKIVQKNGLRKVFLWMSLVFLKTHLKDTYLRKHLDTRNGDELISDNYEWALLHHIHAMVIAEKNKTSIEPECWGSITMIPAKVAEHYENYDYSDIYAANTVLMRIGEIAFIAVLDDSCASLNFFLEQSKIIDGPLSPLQLREVQTILAFFNLKLKYRPQYGTRTDINIGEVSIFTELPDTLALEEFTDREIGELLYSNVEDIIKNMNNTTLNENIENIKAGNFRFLFDESGRFIKNHMDSSNVDR